MAWLRGLSLALAALATTAGAWSLQACGSDANSGENQDSGLSGYGGSGASATGGSGGVVGDAGNCPAQPPATYYGACPLASGESCPFTLECQSGKKTFAFICSPTGPAPWAVAAKPCDKPNDSCPGFDLYCGDGGWELTLNSDPPTRCPEARPNQGDACPNANSFGGARSVCGYPCDAVQKTGWTIATCIGGHWQLDAACTN